MMLDHSTSKHRSKHPVSMK